uniref:DNA helicase Pif1-like 2B domain-containing protein n=1 Tax=Setaria italica TaxID=4555 RepID=K3YBR9_SETIT
MVIGCPVILLRNIDPANGLCNGTRLVHAGKRVFLPRIPLCPSDDEMFPFQFKRKQFPIRLSFAMTLYVAMSRATARTNIKILALPPNAEADEEQTKKKKKKTTNKKVNGQGNQNNNEQKGSSEKKKRVPTVDGTYTKNIVYKEVLTP